MRQYDLIHLVMSRGDTATAEVSGDFYRVWLNPHVEGYRKITMTFDSANHAAEWAQSLLSAIQGTTEGDEALKELTGSL